jgi:hypothetical protein
LRRDTDKEATEKRYLLGTLSEEEGAQLEEQYFADDEAFEEIQIVEEELVDAYVSDSLSASDRARFEQRLLSSPRLLERSRFASTLRESVSSRVPARPASTSKPVQASHRTGLSWWKSVFGSSFTQRPAFRSAFASAAIVMTVGGGLLVSEWRRLLDQSRSIAAERAAIQQQKQDFDRQYAEQQSRNNQLTAELQTLKEEGAQAEKEIEELRRAQEQSKTQSGISSMASLVLFPGSLRGPGAGHDLIVHPGTRRIQLSLGLEANEHRAYRVSIINAAHTEVFHRDGLHPHSNRIVFAIPPTGLERGVYEVRVSGVTSTGAVVPVSEYSFRLVRDEK